MTTRINRQIPISVEQQNSYRRPSDYTRNDGKDDVRDKVDHDTDTRRAEMLADQFKEQMINDMLNK